MTKLINLGYFIATATGILIWLYIALGTFTLTGRWVAGKVRKWRESR
jgi:hypothetical protein